MVSLHGATRADLLRGAYGPYRANNDLLFYHLDMRVDPDKKFLQGKNTIRFRMLKDGRRIQLDLHPALQHRQDRAGRCTTLQYTRDSGARVSSTSRRPPKAGSTYTIDFYYSGHPVETGRFGAITFRKDPAAIPGSTPPARKMAPASGGPTKTSGAMKSEEHGHQRRRAERPDRCLERPLRRQEGPGRRLHALGLAWCTTRSTTTTSR